MFLIHYLLLFYKLTLMIVANSIILILSIEHDSTEGITTTTNNNFRIMIIKKDILLLIMLYSSRSYHPNGKHPSLGTSLLAPMQFGERMQHPFYERCFNAYSYSCAIHIHSHYQNVAHLLCQNVATFHSMNAHSITQVSVSSSLHLVCSPLASLSVANPLVSSHLCFHVKLLSSSFLSLHPSTNYEASTHAIEP